MHLIGIQIQAPDGFVPGNARDHRCIVCGSFRQEIPQRAGIPSPAGIGQLNLGEQPVPAFLVNHIQLPAKQQRIIYHRGSQNLNQEGRELLEWSWRGDMFIAQGGEAMVCGDKQVVSGDPGLVVERRPVWLHYLGIGFPAQLLPMGKGTPCLQGTLMHRYDLHLTGRAREGRGDSLPQETFTASVICSKRPGRAEGVIDKYVGANLNHKP